VKGLVAGAVLLGLAASAAGGASDTLSQGRFALTSPAFPAGGTIPPAYTCDGANVSPPLRWTAPPSGTRSLALIMDDPDAPGGTFTHWTAWNIPPRARGLERGARPPREGTTSFGWIGYGGPCPPPGPPHRYVFRLHALRAPLDLPRGAERAALARALRGRVLARAILVGRYGR
jgi:Raf kinase inhibitor-like YbhB/YbcL family protein